MNRKRLIVVIIAFAAAVVAAVAVYAAGAYGSQEDPLVAKSYLDSVLRPELEKALTAELNSALSDAHSGSGDFAVLTLSSGQSVTGEVGCQIMPRLGTVQASGASAPALLDTTAGASVSSGTALTSNHLYMVSIAGNGFAVTSESATLLISGGYTVN